jgi:hypothetical protein
VPGGCVALPGDSQHGRSTWPFNMRAIRCVEWAAGEIGKQFVRVSDDCFWSLQHFFLVIASFFLACSHYYCITIAPLSHHFRIIIFSPWRAFRAHSNRRRMIRPFLDHFSLISRSFLSHFFRHCRASCLIICHTQSTTTTPHPL